MSDATSHPCTGVGFARKALATLDAGSDAARAISWLLVQNEELLLRTIELDEEGEQDRADRERLDVVVWTIKGCMDMLGVVAGNELRSEKHELYSRDFAPFRNLMAACGVEPYAKPSRKKKEPRK